MEQKKYKIFLKLFIAVLITLGLSIAAQSLLAAWTAPTATPPANNTAAPVNIGDLPQSKTGPLTIDDDFWVTGGTQLDQDVSIGTTTRFSDVILSSHPFALTSNYFNGIEDSSPGLIFVNSNTNNNDIFSKGVLRDYTTLSKSLGVASKDPAFQIFNYKSDPTYIASIDLFPDIYWNGNPPSPGANDIKGIRIKSTSTTDFTGTMIENIRGAESNPSLLIHSGNAFNGRISLVGNVGIGTTTPNSKLHVYNTSANAEIDIQSVAGTNNHWGIYNDIATDQLRIWGNGKNLFNMSKDGNFAVGNSATADFKTAFKVYNISTSTANEYREGVWSALKANPAANSQSEFVAGIFQSVVNDGNAFNFNYASYPYSIVGVHSDAQHRGSGIINGMVGVTSYIRMINGTTGTVTNAYDYYAGNEMTSGTINNLYNLYIASSTKTAGTINNQYGIYIEELNQATKNWTIYASSTAPSFFGGKVGLGTTTVASNLTLSTGATGRIGASEFCAPDGTHCMSLTACQDGEYMKYDDTLGWTCVKIGALHYFVTSQIFTGNLISEALSKYGKTASDGQDGGNILCNNDPNRNPTKNYVASLNYGTWGTVGYEYYGDYGSGINGTDNYTSNTPTRFWSRNLGGKDCQLWTYGAGADWGGRAVLNTSYKIGQKYWDSPSPFWCNGGFGNGLAPLLCVETAASEVVSYWSKSGNYLYPTTLANYVGIGTTTPATPLEVTNITSDPNIILSRDSNNFTMLGYNATNNYGALSTKENTIFYPDVIALKGGRVGVGTTSPSSKIDLTVNNIGVTLATSSALALINTTSAAAGAQQISPAIRLSGSGWATTPLASRPIEWRMYALPVQGTTNPSANFILASSINEGAFASRFTLTSAGALSSISTIANSGAITNTLSTTGVTYVGGLILNGPAATAAILAQNSPIVRFSSKAWNGAASRANEMDIAAVPTSGAITSGRMAFKNTTVDGVANATELMSILSSGNIGIGTTTPAARLEVTNSTNPNIIISKDSNNFTMLGYNTTDNYGALSTKEGGVWNGDTLILKGGNVSIGTTTTTAKLTIQKAFNTSQNPFEIINSANNKLLFVDGNNASLNIWNRLSSNYNLTLAPAGIDVMTLIGGSQRVGIGTSTPQVNLATEKDGRIGAAQFCNEYGQNCIAQTAIGGGGNWTQVGNDLYPTAWNNTSVGIGTSNPDNNAKLDNYHVVSNYDGIGIKNVVTSSDAITADRSMIADSNYIYSSSNPGSYGLAIMGAYNQAGAGNSALYVVGTHSFSSNNTAITQGVDYLYGNDVETKALGAGNTYWAIGTKNIVDNRGSGLIQYAYGIRNEIANTGTGNISNAYLDYGTYPATAVMPINRWGLYMDNEDKNYLSGKLGIGTTTPNARLHVYNTASNAEIDIQSISGFENHWAIYQERAGANIGDLRFWNDGFTASPQFGNNLLTLADEGKILIGGDLKTDRWLNDDSNSFIGVGSGSSTLSHTGGGENGWYNTAYGYNTLKDIATGYSNTAIGSEALRYNTSGANNVAIGNYSLILNTIGANNVAIGNSALYNNADYNNTAIGNGALIANTSGTENTAVGALVMGGNTTGDFNSVFGTSALQNNITGNNNTIMGYRALYNNRSATNTVAIGYKAGYGAGNSSNQNNTLLGYEAGYSVRTGSDNNVFLGYQSGYNEIGSNKLIIENSNIASTSALIAGDFTNDGLNIHGHLAVSDRASMGDWKSGWNPDPVYHITTPSIYSATSTTGKLCLGNNNPTNCKTSWSEVGGFWAQNGNDIINTNTDAGGGAELRVNNPVRIGGPGGANQNSGIYISGTYAYLVNQNGAGDSLQIFDISSSTNPVLISSSNPADTLSKVQVVGQYAYAVGAGTPNLVIVDVSNPKTPVLKGSVTQATLNDIYVSGKYAYVAAFSGLLQIFDISSSTNPVLVGNSAGMNGLSVYVSGKYAYVGDWGAGGSEELSIFDVSDPKNPTLAGPAVVIGEWCKDVYVSGKYAYVGMRDNGANRDFAVYNISNPASPTLVSGFNLGKTVNSVQVSGKYAYLGTDNALLIYDVSNPSSPIQVGTAAPYAGDPISGVQIVGKYAYTIDPNLEIYDISGLDAPTANIGALNVGNLSVWNDAQFSNDLYVESGLNVGPGGIYSRGTLGVSGTTTLMNKVGIGTTTPTTKLNLYDNSSGPIIDLQGLATNYRGVKIAPASDVESWFVGSNPSNNFVIRRSGATDSLTVRATNGNIGIASSTPWAMLSLTNTSANPSFIVEDSVSPDLTPFIIDTNGNVGIGTTTPNSKLHVYNTASNAEIDIQSIAGFENHWAIYQERAGANLEDLRFWNNDVPSSPQFGQNILTLTNGSQIQLGGDLKTDRWRGRDNNTFIGVGVAGAGNLNDTGGSDNGQFNVGLGGNSLNSITRGKYNTAVGYNSLNKLISGFDIGQGNTAIGYKALELLADGASGNSFNTAIGQNAMQNATQGAYNIALGVDTLKNGSAANSIAIGTEALLGGGSGVQDIAIGYQAMSNASGGSGNNIAVGSGSLFNNQGTENIAIGNLAMNVNQTGIYNIAMGTAALQNLNNSARDNIAIGYATMNLQTGGDGNIGIGTNALSLNTSGINNTAIGTYALYQNLNDNNVALGYYAGQGLNNGQSNVFIGYYANAGSGNVTGSNNVVVGENANFNNSGNQNTIIGSGAGNRAAGSTRSGSVFIGYQAGMNETTNNKLYIENSNANSNNALIYGDFNANTLMINGRISVKNAGVTWNPDATYNITTPGLFGSKIEATTLCVGGGLPANCITNWSDISGGSYWTQNATQLYTTDITKTVGIGTTNPDTNYKLYIDGNVYINGTISTPGGDLAEEFKVDKNLEAGTVVVMGDGDYYKNAKPCSKKYDKNVIGVVSETASLKIGLLGDVETEKKAAVALTGVVKVKATNKNGEIKKGDLLATSDLAGYAMKAAENKLGTVIGKALENLESEKGEIMVLINLQ